MNNKKNEWETSYINKDNFVFYPQEDIIRFFAQYIRKRKGLDEWQLIHQNPKVLDLGCGIGRHVVFAAENKVDCYGIDLSETAITFAKDWLSQKGYEQHASQVNQGDITQMPFENEFFDFVISHGVIDSMSFDIARKAMEDTYRVMKKGGLFYCDLISGDDSSHFKEFSGEEIVETEHEKGTIQLYFNYSLLQELISGLFSIKNATLIRKQNVINPGYISRYHVVLEK